MAKLKAFSVFDSKLQVWMAPMFLLHTGQAERTWADIVNDGASMPGKHPQDFALYQVGEFDDSTGALTHITPVSVMTATAIKNRAGDQGVMPLQSRA